MDGQLERSKFTSVSDSWSLSASEVRTIKIECEPLEASIEKIVDSTKIGFYILIDEQPYYKLFENPDQE